MFYYRPQVFSLEAIKVSFPEKWDVASFHKSICGREVAPSEKNSPTTNKISCRLPQSEWLGKPVFCMATSTRTLDANKGAPLLQRCKFDMGTTLLTVMLKRRLQTADCAGCRPCSLCRPRRLEFFLINLLFFSFFYLANWFAGVFTYTFYFLLCL